MTTMLRDVKFAELCKSIIGIDKSILSVVVINKFGRPMEKISSPTFTKQFPDYLNEFFCMHCVLQVSMGRDFDENYGPVNYHISERKSLTTISFSVNDDVVVVTTNKDTFPIAVAKKLLEILEKAAWS